tara:strand:+ start:121 stop:522 length:402 start_codon:yes stop_codon:yes gene_type:complete
MNTPNSDDASTDSDHDEDDLSDPMVTQNMRSAGSKVTNQVDSNQIAQFVTTIKNAEQQVGEHIITALQHDDTVAVITTVVIGDDGQQRVVSASLNPARLQQVQELLLAATQEREEEEPCVGFHCLVKPKGSQD